MVKIVKAEIEDAEGIQEVQYKTWLATYPNEELGITIEDIEDRFKDRLLGKLKKRREEILHPISGVMFVAKENNKVVGFCKTGEIENKNELQAIYVLTEYQGRGIGKMLWDEAKNYLDINRDTVVHVATYNENAIYFYQRLGFKDTGKRWSDEKFKMKRSGTAIPEMEMILRANDK
jgi:ribosomal protein S18 acetylase RimI-like enzyme